MPSYVVRCQLIGIQPLELRRKYFAIIFIRDILTSQINCPFLLSLINIYAPTRNLRVRRIFYESLHRVNYGLNEPFTRCIREVNIICDRIDFHTHLSRNAFKRHVLFILSSS